MSEVSYEQATKAYGDELAVDALDLTVSDGELIVLVGPSGSGKSTALRMLAGLEEVDAGAIRIGGEDVTDLPPKQRDVAMVFQNYSLYPYLDVAANMAFPLKMAHVKAPERKRRVQQVAELLDIVPYLGRRPGQRSGGQRQRVAMGRALVREPRVFLMDEPLSNLDAKLRTSMRGELARLHERLPTTTVYVTHDQVEAMTLGERVAVLKDGKVQQCDVPQRLFDEPANLFVGAFIGSPAMNLVEATVAGGLVRFGGEEILLEGAAAGLEGEVVLGIRPTSLSLAEAHMDAGWPRMTARIDIVEALGAERNVLFTVDAPPVTAEDAPPGVGGVG